MGEAINYKCKACSLHTEICRYWYDIAQLRIEQEQNLVLGALCL